VQKLKIPATEYHARPEVNASMIRTFQEDGPLECYAQCVAKTKVSARSEAKDLGTAFHLAMSKPNSWLDYYCILPDELGDDEALLKVRKEWSGKSSKALLVPGETLSLKLPPHRQYVAYLRAAAEENKQEILSAEQLETTKGMIDAIRQNPICRYFIDSSREDNTEVTYLSRNDDVGLDLRALVDLDLKEEHNTIVDYKTTRFPTKYQFCRDALKKGYHYQAAHYLHVTGAFRYVLIAIKNSPPYVAMAYECPQVLLDSAHRSNLIAMQSIKDCMDTGTWLPDGWGALNFLQGDEIRETI